MLFDIELSHLGQWLSPGQGAGWLKDPLRGKGEKETFLLGIPSWTVLNFKPCKFMAYSQNLN